MALNKIMIVLILEDILRLLVHIFMLCLYFKGNSIVFIILGKDTYYYYISVLVGLTLL